MGHDLNVRVRLFASQPSVEEYLMKTALFSHDEHESFLCVLFLPASPKIQLLAWPGAVLFQNTSDVYITEQK